MRSFILVLCAQVAVAKSLFKTKYTVKDKVYVNDNIVAENNSLDGVVGTCTHEFDGFNKVKVCGCNVRVVANLMTECKEYGKYTQKVGSCDCAKDGCEEVSFQSGYTNKFKWDAVSYKIENCK